MKHLNNMKVKLKTKMPMFREEPETTEPIWFEEGEEFEVVSKEKVKHDGQEWYKIKSKWFRKPLKGLHNPYNFEVIKEEERILDEG